MNHPLVTIIIPTKNSARTLGRCLDSVKKQTYQPIELIVVDNNSTDTTKEIAQHYTNSVYNFGPERSFQRNFGVSKSHGEYVLVHDSDIYFDPDTVTECVKIILDGHFDALVLPERSIGKGFWTKVKAFERSFYIGNDYIEAARFFKKDVYQKIGGYDEDLYAGEDWDLTIRLREQGFKIGRATHFIEHDEGELRFFGSSKKKEYYASNFFAVYAKKHPEYVKKQMSFFTRFPLFTLLHKALRHPVLCTAMILMKMTELIYSYKNK